MAIAESELKQPRTHRQAAYTVDLFAEIEAMENTIKMKELQNTLLIVLSIFLTAVSGALIGFIVYFGMR
jgi:ABC-type enterochelin transport system permease subunit